MNLTERLQEAFDKRVCGTAMLPTSDLLSAMTAIEQAEAENAALKKQVAQLESLVSRYSKGMKDNLAECLKGQETIAQLRIEADFNFDQYQDAGRLLCDLQEIAEQQAEAIRLKDVAIIFAIEHEDALDRDNRWYTLTKALSIQPSPETLQARDKRVAEACAKALNPGEWPNECDRNIGYKDVECIRSGEWRKYL